jgi:hypothetical protein
MFSLSARQRDALAANWPHWRRYHALPLEHANRNLIFNYKIASVCGILIGTGNQKLSEVHDYLRSSYLVGTPDAQRTACSRR